MALGKLGKYERVDVLGHGMSGIVYLAWDTLLKKQVALKEIDIHAADIDRFLEEARVLDRLRHTNIVRVNGVDKLDGHVVMDMEYVKGSNLQQILRQEQRLDLARAIDIAIQTLDALEYAHSMHTVHRDIKPANILVSRQGEVKLVDFGLAQILSTNSYAGGAGTYAYMAPEDFAEDRQSDHRGDIWAVGVTLYEMLTGARPFVVEKTRDPFAWRRALAEQPHIPLAETELGRNPEYSPLLTPLEGILASALAHDKQDRFPSAAAFRDALSLLRTQFCLPVPVGPMSEVTAHNGLAVVQSAVPQLIRPPETSKADDGTQTHAEKAKPDANRAELAKPAARGALASIRAMPSGVDFGSLPKGDERGYWVRLKAVGFKGKQTGELLHAPEWLDVHPKLVTRKSEKVRLTLRTERVWQTGAFTDSVRFKTAAGEVEIPVAVWVEPSRPTFASVSAWFVPLTVVTLLPACIASFGAHLPGARALIPAAALTSGLLAAMVVRIASAARLGGAERAAAGVLALTMFAVLGASLAGARTSGDPIFWPPIVGLGLPLAGAWFCQAASGKWWKGWIVGVAVLAMLASGALFRAVFR